MIRQEVYDNYKKIKSIADAIITELGYDLKGNKWYSTRNEDEDIIKKMEIIKQIIDL